MSVNNLIKYLIVYIIHIGMYVYIFIICTQDFVWPEHVW